MSARDPGEPARCVGEPVSWLALERLRLGELPPGERHAVEQHLAACAACAACLAEIERPLNLPALPPLPSPAQPATFWSRARAAWRGAGRVRIWAPAGVAVLLAVFAARAPETARRHAGRPHARGRQGRRRRALAGARARRRDRPRRDDVHRPRSLEGAGHLPRRARGVLGRGRSRRSATATFPLAPASPIAAATACRCRARSGSTATARSRSACCWRPTRSIERA